jgi:hypothetical protein
MCIVVPENMGIQRNSILTGAQPPLKDNIFQDLQILKKLHYRVAVFPKAIILP